MIPRENFLIAGCGYLGRKVARHFLQDDISFAALVNTDSSRQSCLHMGIEAQIIDLDQENPPAIDSCADTILYTIPPQPQGDTDLRIDRFLSALQQPPKKFILISTTGIYGDCDGAWIDESTPPAPQADRARRRLSAEQQVQTYASEYGIHWVILRVAGIYGPDKLPLQRLHNQEPILKEEDAGYSNRIHADDLADVCHTACISKKMEGIYNCTDGNPTTMSDYFIRLARALGLEEPEQIPLSQAREQLSAGMLSYLAESKRIDNRRLLAAIGRPLKYPDLTTGLRNIRKPIL